MATAAQVKSFIDLLAPLAIEECRKRGYGNAQAWTCVAQSCIETGYGTSTLMTKANAFFGIKAHTGWKGRVYSSATKECYDGKTYVSINAAFRAYASVEDSVKDYFDLMETTRYRASLNATTVRDCVGAIKIGGYATDPSYVNKVVSVYERNKVQIEKYKVENGTKETKQMSVFSSLITSKVDFGTAKSNPRTKPIIKITPHHTAGTASATATAKSHRDTTRQASANYYISDDSIVGGVSEDRRAWTSGGKKTNNGMTGRDNDFVAITFEVSNSKMGGDWPISDKSYRSLVRLCADICKRYNIVPHWDGTSKGTITTHDLFAATSCPGPYLKRLITSGQFEKDILAEMGNVPAAKPSVPKTNPTPAPVQSGGKFRVQIGAFKNLAQAKSFMDQFVAKGYTARVVKIGTYYKVQHPASGFATEADANLSAGALKKLGYPGAFVVSDN